MLQHFVICLIYIIINFFIKVTRKKDACHAPYMLMFNLPEETITPAELGHYLADGVIDGKILLIIIFIPSTRQGYIQITVALKNNHKVLYTELMKPAL